MKTELQNQIVAWLKEQGIEARAINTGVAVNRDSMCNSKFANDEIPEEGAHPNTKAAIERRFSSQYGFYWGHKTDEELFLYTVLED